MIVLTSLSLLFGESHNLHSYCCTGSDNPVKVFDRHPTLAGTQIINYRVDANLKWLVRIGISAVEGRVAGKVQLYSVDKKKMSQVLDGHASSFAQFKVPGNQAHSTVLIVANRGVEGGKVCIELIDILMLILISILWCGVSLCFFCHVINVI